MVSIVNWLLTRRCNLSCSYCAISRNYPDIPPEYPNMDYYSTNEMKSSFVIDLLSRFKKNNPDCFHILYGGEPLLYKGIDDVINYCNKEKINYTLITNGTQIARSKLTQIIEEGKIDFLQGLTCSIDPKGNSGRDINLKSQEGFKTLLQFEDVAIDRVAEITLTKDNVNNIIPLLEKLTNKGICGDITGVDIKLNPYYDFSLVEDSRQLLYPSKELRQLFNEIISRYDLLIHMRHVMNDFYNMLPYSKCSSYVGDPSNISIDADGSLRLCLRIKGIESQKHKIEDIIDSDGNIDLIVNRSMDIDRDNLCGGCNWTCRLFSESVSLDTNQIPNLLHSDIRKEYLDGE